MNKKTFLFKAIGFIFIAFSCVTISFFSNLFTNKPYIYHSLERQIKSNSVSVANLIDELKSNKGNFDNNLKLNLDLSRYLKYENDYYNWTSSPPEHIKLNVNKESKITFNISDINKINFINKDTFNINDAYNIISNENIKVNLEAPSYDVVLKNKIYNSNSVSLNLNKTDFDLDINLVNPITINMDYCKILRVDFKRIIFNINNNKIHTAYHYFNPNNIAYPSAILYMNSWLVKNIDIILNNTIPIYFVYDVKFEKLLTFETTNFVNDLNNITTTPPSLKLNFDLEKLFYIKKRSDEYNVDLSTNFMNFYYNFLWTKALPLFFIDNSMSALLQNENLSQNISLWENNKFITNELIIDNNFNKQKNILSNVKKKGDNSYLNIDFIYKNSFAENKNINFSNNKLLFDFTSRKSFKNINSFYNFSDSLLFESNKFASELVDSNKNIYDKDIILDFLNSKISIFNGSLFSEILTFNDINFNKFKNYEKDLKRFGINLVNNSNYYLPTFNENGEIFFLAKIINWNFINDTTEDSFQGDYSKDFKDKILNHKNIIYLTPKEHFSNDGYFVIKILTNKITTIKNHDDSNVFWKFDANEISNVIRNFINDNSNYQLFNESKNNFVFTFKNMNKILKRDKNLDILLNKNISLNFVKPNKENFGNPIENILVMLYNLPLNQSLVDANKMVIKINNNYSLNKKYKLHFNHITEHEYEMKITNKSDENFCLNISLDELSELLNNNIDEQHLTQLINSADEYVLTSKLINWYFILFVILIFFMLIILVLFICKRARSAKTKLQ